MQSNYPNTFRWIWKESGSYTTKSAYRAFFFGLTNMPGAKEIWSSKAPLQLKFFAWLAVKNRCWTSDRLIDRGLPQQPCCPLCLQEPETLSHILIQCSYAREIWFKAFRSQAWESFTPGHQDSLVDWWTGASEAVPQYQRRAFNSSVILTMHSIWKERNRRVTDKVYKLASVITAGIEAEWRTWSRA